MSIRVAREFQGRWSCFWATSYSLELELFDEYLLRRLGEPPLNATLLVDFGLGPCLGLTFGLGSVFGVGRLARLCDDDSNGSDYEADGNEDRGCGCDAQKQPDRSDERLLVPEADIIRRNIERTVQE